MIFSAGINGLGSSLLWVGQSTYISQCASEENKGRFYGTFWFLFMWSQIVGNLLGAYVLSSFSKVMFFVLMSIISLLGTSTFLLLTRPLKHYELLSETSAEENGQMNEQLTDEQQEERQMFAGILSTIRLLASGKMMRLNLFFIFSGLVVATYCGFLVPTISSAIGSNEKSNEKLKKCLLCMAALGVA